VKQRHADGCAQVDRLGDSDGTPANKSWTAQIGDAPLNDPNNANYTFVAPLNQSWTGVVGYFVDTGNPPDTGATYTTPAPKITWGDGSSSTGTVSGPVLENGLWTFSVTGTHTYTTSGSLSVSTTVTDDGGASVTIQSKAEVLAW
jgi:hypothetical protein